MTKAVQLSMPLFDLSPRNKGKRRIEIKKGGLSELQITNFKGIKNLSVDFSPVTLLIGSNNSGKSTILQAVRLFYYCIEKCGVYNSANSMRLKKQVMPFSDFSLIPAHEVKELVLNGITPSSRKHGIYLKGTLLSGQTFDFTIYTAYSTLLVILPGQTCPAKLRNAEYDNASRQPLYVPGFSGVVTRELLSTNRRLEESLGSGHHNEVLRNLILRLQPDDLKHLAKILVEEFSVRFQGIPGNPNDVEFLKASYREPLLRINLDVVSAGSGFLQVLQILTHALQSPSPILLLDEPDAHMHTQLQEHFISLLREFAKNRDMQIIMASHSETFTRTMELSEIRLIDRGANRADSFSDPLLLRSELNNQGVWPDEPKLAEALRIKRLLLCESFPDHDLLCSFAQSKNPDWFNIKKHYEVIKTEGANDNVVARIKIVYEIFNKLLNGDVKIAYFRDRDLMCDEHKLDTEQQSSEADLNLIITERRNRESYLIEPRVVEAALLSQKDKLPKKWLAEGYISNLVKDWCIEFCNERRTELPPKIREYNLYWERSNYPESSDQRKVDARIEEFIQDNWYRILDAKEIPWKLMDGRGALKFIRGKLQAEGIMLPDQLLLEHVNVVQTPKEFSQLIKIIESWI